VTSTLTGGASPTGSVSFTVFGPQVSPPTSCASGGTPLGTATVSGDGSYHPASGFTPPSDGDYWWYASYSGDGANSPATSTCGAGMAETVLATSSPAVPILSKSPVISGPPDVGRTLGCSDGTWSNTPTGFAFQWKRTGVLISGATTATYTVVAADQGNELTCTVVARNTAGPSQPATSQAVTIPAGCPAATGTVHGATLGSFRLGETRAAAERVDGDRSTHGKKYFEFFCLTPSGVTVGYNSPKLDKATHTSAGERVVLILTANPAYAIHGIRAGASVKAASKKLKLGKPIAIGAERWYLATDGSVTATFVARHGIIDEVGIAERKLTVTRTAQRTFLTSFS
jgi:hypothetical protein